MSTDYAQKASDFKEAIRVFLNCTEEQIAACKSDKGIFVTKQCKDPALLRASEVIYDCLDTLFITPGGQLTHYEEHMKGWFRGFRFESRAIMSDSFGPTAARFSIRLVVPVPDGELDISHEFRHVISFNFS
jgi:hypothetical protein